MNCWFAASAKRLRKARPKGLQAAQIEDRSGQIRGAYLTVQPAKNLRKSPAKIHTLRSNVYVDV
jgi:hypothetical protein